MRAKTFVCSNEHTGHNAQILLDLVLRSARLSTLLRQTKVVPFFEAVLDSLVLYKSNQQSLQLEGVDVSYL